MQSNRSDVLVAVDGSPQSLAAAEWAAVEAARRDVRLLVVHVVDSHTYGLWGTTGLIRDGLRELAKPIVETAGTHARRQEPAVRIKTAVLIAGPSHALLRLSSRVGLIVVGRSGVGALSRLLLGSVAHRLMANAECPVVVIGGDHAHPVNPPTRVVAAIDHVAGHSRTLQFAFEAAERHRTPVAVVRVISNPTLVLPVLTVLEADMRPWLLAHASVPCTVTVECGEITEAFARLCDPADLLVVGHHSRGMVVPHVLGHVVTSLASHTSCSLAVVHEPFRPGDERYAGQLEADPHLTAV